MAVYRYPSAPQDSVFVRGVEFIDGVSADVTVSDDTLTLFNAYGIVAADAEPEWEAFVSGKPDGRSTKAALQAAAEALGLDTKGTKAELQARIDEHTAAESDTTEE